VTQESLIIMKTIFTIICQMWIKKPLRMNWNLTMPNYKIMMKMSFPSYTCNSKSTHLKSKVNCKLKKLKFTKKNTTTKNTSATTKKDKSSYRKEIVHSRTSWWSLKITMQIDPTCKSKLWTTTLHQAKRFHLTMWMKNDTSTFTSIRKKEDN
jgi:hypothetical protein